MKNKNIVIHGKNITLRLMENKDISEYYKNGFESIDKEVQQYTGTKHIGTEEEIRQYVERIVEDDSRYDFLIINAKGQIIGESVINEINNDNKSANFRIALFKSEYCGQGIGTEVIKMTLQFGFEKLKLHRIELEVFSFNERAYTAYRRVGFIEEGRKRDAEFINSQYCDVIIMGILHDEYSDDAYSIELT